MLPQSFDTNELLSRDASRMKHIGQLPAGAHAFLILKAHAQKDEMRVACYLHDYHYSTCRPQHLIVKERNDARGRCLGLVSCDIAARGTTLRNLLVAMDDEG